MKKVVLVATSALILAGSLHARGGHGSYYYDGWNGWIAPFFIGSMLGYSVARQPVIYTTSPAVIYTNAPVGMIQDSYTVQENEGPVYEERWVYFEDCKCERKVLVNIQQ